MHGAVLLFGCIGMLPCLVLNGISIVIFWRKLITTALPPLQHHQHYTDLVFLSLAINDIIRSGVGFFFLIYEDIERANEDSVPSCNIGFVVTFTLLVSLAHLLGISMERCITLSDSSNFQWIGMWYGYGHDK